MCFLAVASVAAELEVESIRVTSNGAAMTTTSALRSDAPTGQPAFSAAFARPGDPVYTRPSREHVDAHATATLGQEPARTNRTFTVYTCGIPDDVAAFLPFQPGCRAKLVGCPRGDCTHWPIENGLEMEETSVKGVFTVTTDLYDEGDEFAFALYEGTCTPWEEEYCILKGTCGERLNCEHRYDSGLAFDFKQVACYSENREMENHTCAGNSPLVEKPCATKFVTSGDGYVWYNRVVPADARDVSYVWGSCDEAPSDVDAVCGAAFTKPPCFSMPEVSDPPVCTAAELDAKRDGFVDYSPDLTLAKYAGHTGFCADEPVCRNATDRDVLFLLDASASQSERAFAADLVPMMRKLYCAAHTTTASRVGVMIFPGFDADTCNGGQMLIPMGRYSPDDFEARVEAIRDRCCATATPTAEALMLARDVLKGSNEFGLNNALVYMISDGGPAMNFGHVDCSDAAEDRYKRLSRWTTTVLGHEPDFWQGIDGETSDHCHYSYRYVQLYGMLHQMFSSRVVFVGVPNNGQYYPQPSQFIGGFIPWACYVNATGQFCAMRNVGYGVNAGSTIAAKAHNPDILSRDSRGLRVSWGKARSSCAFENPTMYSFISKPFYANYHNVARWNDPDIMRRPFEMMCDPNPCLDETLDEGVEHVALCYGDRMRRGRWGAWGNTKRCLEDRGVDACRAKFAYDAGTDVDRAVYSGETRGSSYEVSFTCRVTRAGTTAEETLGSMSVSCDDLQKCVGTWD